jgi:aminoglycoside 3-N-acetyltransferase I
MTVEIKKLHKDDIDDFYQLLNVFDSTFEYEECLRADETHLKQLLQKEDFLVVVAMIDDKVVAGLTAYVLDQYHSNLPILYSQDLAVLNEFQRKGIGRKVIAYTNQYCKENNFQLMFIQAEKVDDYAVDFYRSTLPSGEEEVVYFYYNY